MAEPLFTNKFLREALTSTEERVSIWAAYQFLLVGEPLDVVDLRLFLQSDIPDIQEAGLNKLAEQNEGSLLSDVVRIFREAEGQLKYTAAYVISQFPNDINRRLIRQWLDGLLFHENSTQLEIESAAQSIIAIAPVEGFELVLQEARNTQGNVVKSSALWSAALPFADERGKLSEMIEAYFQLREEFSDTGLIFQLSDHYSNPELLGWISNSLASGFPLSEILEQGSKLFDSESSFDMQPIFQELEGVAIYFEVVHMQGPRDFSKMLELLQEWMLKIKKRSSHPCIAKADWLLAFFSEQKSLFNSAIPKMKELEARLLLSLPIAALQTIAFDRWKEEVSAHFSDIANYYHSPLLTHQHCEELLATFFPNLPAWGAEELKFTQKSDFDRESKSKAELLWSLYRGEFLGVEVNWPSLFPNPFVYQNLSYLLLQIYAANFAELLKRKDDLSIDYALQLFQKHPSVEVADLMVEHFEELLRFHGEMLYQTIEFIPLSCFSTELMAHHHQGETEQAKLIWFLCKVNQLEVPPNIMQELETEEKEGVSPFSKPVRLYCDSCKQSFQYPVDEIFVDEGAIHRMNQLKAESLWVNRDFICKSCGEKVQFNLDVATLEAVSQQSRVDRLLSNHQPTRNSPFSYRIILVDFPRFEGRVYSPSDFMAMVETAQYEPMVMDLLYMKLARLYRGMGQFESIPAILKNLSPNKALVVEWAFLLGQSYFKSGDYAEARKYFEIIIPKDDLQRPETADLIWQEKAKYLLKAMSSYAVKRSRFQVITGKK